MKALPAFAAACFLAASLAGCAGKTAAPSDSLASNADNLDLQATATTGVLRGVVVDDAIRPIANATVTLKSGTPQETRTNALGAFGFDGLAAGTYFIAVHKRGYRDTQQSAEVVAGEAEPKVLKVLLPANPSELPSYDVYHFAGFLECNVALPLVFIPCQNPATGDPIGNDNFEATYNLTGNITFIHVSLIWQATEPVGTELYYNVFPKPGDDSTTCDPGCWTGGPSPLLLDIDSSKTQPFQDSGTVSIDVSGNGEQGLAGAELQQSFDAYIVVFHNFTPPEGYSYAADGDPVPPQ